MSTYQEYWRELGVEKGYKLGIAEGIERGRREGIERGRQEGIERGRQEGIERGRQEGIERGRQEGIERGRQEGIERLRDSVRRVLQMRFGQVPGQVGEKLAETEDLDALQDLLVTASTANSLQEFLEILDWHDRTR